MAPQNGWLRALWAERPQVGPSPVLSAHKGTTLGAELHPWDLLGDVQALLVFRGQGQALPDRGLLLHPLGALFPWKPGCRGGHSHPSASPPGPQVPGTRSILPQGLPSGSGRETCRAHTAGLLTRAGATNSRAPSRSQSSHCWSVGSFSL